MVAKLARKPKKNFRARHLDGASPWTRVAKKDPTKDYVWVNKTLGAECGGPDYYALLGYELVRRETGGPEIVAGHTCEMGDPLESQGNVLMCIDKKELARQREEGHDLGATGAASHRAVMQHIIDSSSHGGLDPLKGVQGLVRQDGHRYMSAINDTKPLEAEILE